MEWQKLFFWRRPTPNVLLAKNDKHNEGDKLVIEGLREEGADLSREREILHYLYLPTEDAANQASRELRAEGYDVEQRKASNADQNPPNPWLVLAKTETVIDNDSAERASLRFTELASRNGGEYDGWELSLSLDLELPPYAAAVMAHEDRGLKPASGSARRCPTD